jgi:histidinol-phosphate/aromatic aminotransferase/cobyric acid decarboxylase-like protein
VLVRLNTNENPYRPSQALIDDIAESVRKADFSLDIDYSAAMIAEHRPDIVFVTNPHSPTGHSLGITELEGILSAARESWGAPSPADSRRA